MAEFFKNKKIKVAVLSILLVTLILILCSGSLPSNQNIETKSNIRLDNLQNAIYLTDNGEARAVAEKHDILTDSISHINKENLYFTNLIIINYSELAENEDMLAIARKHILSGRFLVILDPPKGENYARRSFYSKLFDIKEAPNKIIPSALGLLEREYNTQYVTCYYDNEIAEGLNVNWDAAGADYGIENPLQYFDSKVISKDGEGMPVISEDARAFAKECIERDGLELTLEEALESINADMGTIHSLAYDWYTRDAVIYD